MRVQFYRDRLWGQLIPFRHINGHVYEKVEQINGQRHWKPSIWGVAGINGESEIIVPLQGIDSDKEEQ